MLTSTWTHRLLAAALLAGLSSGIVVGLDSPAAGAPAAPAYRPTAQPTRVGLNCNTYRYLIWTVRACVTVRARKDRLGQWEVQPAAAIAGYNRSGRRRMKFVVATRLEGYGSAGAGFTERLVERGIWQTPAGPVGRAKAVFVWRYPNGRKATVKMYSDP